MKNKLIDQTQERYPCWVFAEDTDAAPIYCRNEVELQTAINEFVENDDTPIDAIVVVSEGHCVGVDTLPRYVVRWT